MKPIHVFAAAALAAVAVPAHADPVEEKNVVAGKDRLDPTMGYVFASPGMRMAYTFLRAPDAESRAKYQEDWDKAFAKAQKRYTRDFAAWRAEVEAFKPGGVSPRTRPIEPSPETFFIDPIETRDMVSFGPMFVYSKADDRITYLQAMKPGTYIFYGPILAMNGMVTGGICYCMGSVKFEVKPGLVTDIGNFLNYAPEAPGDWDVASKEAREREAKKGTAAAARPAVAFGLPATLKGWPSAQAEFHASGKMNNYFGIVISRIPPVRGVIGYRRDVIVDERTGSEVPSPTIRTMVKIKR